MSRSSIRGSFSSSWRLEPFLCRNHGLAWAVLLLWVGYSSLSFWSLGMATQDQIDFSLRASNGGYLLAAWEEARAQGRLYFLLTKPIDYILASHPELFLSKAATFVSFVLAPVFFAYAFFRKPAERLVFIWIYFCVVWVGFQHLPPAAYPVTNDSPFLFWAAGAWFIRRADSRPTAAVLATSTFAFLAFFQYEPITAMSLIGFVWMVFSAPIERRRKRQLYMAVACSAMLYMALYLIWKSANPSTYAGSQLSALPLGAVIRTYLAYTLGALPSHAIEASPLIWGDAIIGKTSFAFPRLRFGSMPTPHTPALFVFGLLAAGSVLMLRLRALRQEGPDPAFTRHRNLAPLLAILAMLGVANGLVALSVRYQDWAQSIPSVYLTSRLALLPLVALFVWLIERGLERFAVSLRVLAWMLIGGFLVTTWVAVQAQNQSAAPRLRANLAKWDAVGALMACKDSLPPGAPMVVPGLFYSIDSVEADWAGYWSRFVQHRFGIQTQFHHAPLQAGPFSHALMQYADNGALQSMTIRIPDAVLYLSSSPAQPGFLFAGGDTGWPIVPAEARRCADSRFFTWKFTAPALLEAPLERIWPVATAPVRPAISLINYSQLMVPAEQLTSAAEVLYQLYLGRAGDPDGIAFWAAKAQEGRGSLLRIIEEFERLKGASTTESDVQAVMRLTGPTTPSDEETAWLRAAAGDIPAFARRWQLYQMLQQAKHQRPQEP